MMTWMPMMSMFDSAAALETDLLAQTAREAEALFNEMIFDVEDEELGKAPTPLRLMWLGHEVALAGYAIAAMATLVGRGINTGLRATVLSDTIVELRATGDPAPLLIPGWFSDTDVLRSHRSNLMRRYPGSYSWKGTKPDMPYIWPIVFEDGTYELRLSKHDKDLLAAGERTLPRDIQERISNA